jgi:hypothetical protein
MTAAQQIPHSHSRTNDALSACWNAAWFGAMTGAVSKLNAGRCSCRTNGTNNEHLIVTFSAKR